MIKLNLGRFRYGGTVVNQSFCPTFWQKLLCNFAKAKPSSNQVLLCSDLASPRIWAKIFDLRQYHSKTVMLTVFSFLFLASCSTPNWYKPMGHTLFKKLPKGGTPGFNLGWIHGCESGLGTQFATAIYHTFYTWKRDVDITSVNPDIPKIRARYKKELKDVNWDDLNDVKKNFSDYNTIFWGAHQFCHGAVLGILQTATMNPTLAGDQRYNPGGHSLMNIWRLQGKGDARIGTSGYW